MDHRYVHDMVKQCGSETPAESEAPAATGADVLEDKGTTGASASSDKADAAEETNREF